MKKFIWVVFAAMALLNSGLAHADSITGTISGDNNVSYWNGSSWVSEGSNWGSAETLNLNITGSSDIVYFAVSNDTGEGGNPAAFIGSFTDNNGTFAQTGTNTLLSNTSFSILAVSPWTTDPSLNPGSNPTVDPTTLSGFTNAISYGANNANNIWSQNDGGLLNGVDPNAQWIWTANNDEYYSSPGQDNFAIIAAQLGVNSSVVPEPSTVWLFVFAGAMIVFLMRMRILKVA